MKKLLSMLTFLAVFVSFEAVAQINIDSLGNNANQNSQEELFTNGVKIFHKIPGKGRSPSEFSTVTVEYKGTLRDGKVFDTSSRPIKFKLNGVIQCWKTAVQSMRTGETAVLQCPANMAYGEKGVTRPLANGNIEVIIPPNAPLTFEVRLIEFTN